jgi:hypothetical protein
VRFDIPRTTGRHHIDGATAVRKERLDHAVGNFILSLKNILCRSVITVGPEGLPVADARQRQADAQPVAAALNAPSSTASTPSRCPIAARSPDSL